MNIEKLLNVVAAKESEETQQPYLQFAVVNTDKVPEGSEYEIAWDQALKALSDNEGLGGAIETLDSVETGRIADLLQRAAEQDKGNESYPEMRKIKWDYGKFRIVRFKCPESDKCDDPEEVWIKGARWWKANASRVIEADLAIITDREKKVRCVAKVEGVKKRADDRIEILGYPLPSHPWLGKEEPDQTKSDSKNPVSYGYGRNGKRNK